jgi:arrestin-related trafficking adapter 3/6
MDRIGLIVAGIPPKKLEFEEVNTIMSHTWPFFNAQFATAENSTGADHVELLQKSPTDITGKRASLDMRDLLRKSNTSMSNITKADRRMSLQVTSIVNGRDVSPNPGSVAQKGYKIFQPGDYVYNFELPLDSHIPETIDVELGSVKYELEATVERAGAFRGNLVGSKEVVLIRTPAEGSLEQVEPIAIARNWDQQLHYDIVISGKSFPLGSQIPIAFKLTPLAKVQCHRIKVFITESVEYFCSNRRVHRTEPARKILLFEKRADNPPVSTYPGSSMRVVSGGGVPYDLRAAAARGEAVRGTDPHNILGNLEAGDGSIGPTELEINVQLPTCKAFGKDKNAKLHFDTSYHNIQVHHWIKVSSNDYASFVTNNDIIFPQIVLRLSRPDASDPSKRRHFEISIDSPFHILSCQATQHNIFLPAYTSPDQPISGDPRQYQCGCPGSPARRNSPPTYVPTLSSFGVQSPTISSLSSSDLAGTNIQPPPAAHISGDTSPPSDSSFANAHPRPMHIIRVPSYNPPAFDAEQPPPPLETPPPQYDSIASPTTGLADYFARLSDAYSTAETELGDEEEDGDGMSTPTQRRSLVIDQPTSSDATAVDGNWV